jgi:ubiquinone/menaquinone biosynthesis C-methylase UbiE
LHNLNEWTLPLNDNSFDKVYVKDTLFLLNDPVAIMEEIIRVSKKDAEIIITQPYFRSVWTFIDPWVKNYGTVHSFAFYDPGDLICKR